jgi:hypothetical protein
VEAVEGERVKAPAAARMVKVLSRRVATALQVEVAVEDQRRFAGGGGRGG